jgi:NADP-dependent 3-hydroxy acid dehydrogenase YdfG
MDRPGSVADMIAFVTGAAEGVGEACAGHGPRLALP